eukprot:5975106-Prymnesium_polylepis.1
MSIRARKPCSAPSSTGGPLILSPLAICCSRQLAPLSSTLHSKPSYIQSSVLHCESQTPLPHMSSRHAVSPVRGRASFVALHLSGQLRQKMRVPQSSQSVPRGQTPVTRAPIARLSF